MIKTFTINKGQKPTEEQLQEVMKAKKRPIVFDADSPELSPTMCKAFKCSVIQRNRKKYLDTVSSLDSLCSDVFVHSINLSTGFLYLKRCTAHWSLSHDRF